MTGAAVCVFAVTAASIAAAGGAPGIGVGAALAGAVASEGAAALPSCALPTSGPAGFFVAGAGASSVAAAVLSVPAAAAADATACATAAVGFPGASGRGSVPELAPADGVAFAEAPAVPGVELAESPCCPAVAGPGAEPFVLAAVALAVLTAFFAPLAARVFKSAALALAAALPGQCAAALVWPVSAVVPWGAAGAVEDTCPAAGRFPVEAGVALSLFAAGALADEGLWAGVCCTPCWFVCAGSEDGLADGPAGAGAGFCGAAVVASSKAAKGCEFGFWLAVDVWARDAGVSETAAVTSDVILGTRELPETTWN